LIFAPLLIKQKWKEKRQIKSQQVNTHLNLAKIQKHKVKLNEYQSVCNIPMAEGFITA
jgi:hypothetical protein